MFRDFMQAGFAISAAALVQGLIDLMPQPHSYVMLYIVASYIATFTVFLLVLMLIHLLTNGLPVIPSEPKPAKTQ